MRVMGYFVMEVSEFRRFDLLLFELKIDTPVISALGSIRTNVYFSAFFCFPVRNLYRTDKRIDGEPPFCFLTTHFMARFSRLNLLISLFRLKGSHKHN